jgi:hypothetical protein
LPLIVEKKNSAVNEVFAAIKAHRTIRSTVGDEAKTLSARLFWRNERTFATLGITAEHRAQVLPDKVLCFRNGMLTTARDDSYLDGIGIVMAAEWMYATWCTRAASSRISNPELKR